MGSVTKHGGKRMKTRKGLNMKSVERQAELAIERGLYHRDMTGRLHKWVTSVMGYNRTNGCKYIIYNNSLFVFHKDYSRVITVINVPSNLHDIVVKQMKRIQNEESESGLELKLNKIADQKG